MRATKSPGALAASGALELDQLSSTVISRTIVSFERPQALRIVVAPASHCSFHNNTLSLGGSSSAPQDDGAF